MQIDHKIKQTGNSSVIPLFVLAPTSSKLREIQGFFPILFFCAREMKPHKTDSRFSSFFYAALQMFLFCCLWSNLHFNIQSSRHQDKRIMITMVSLQTGISVAFPSRLPWHSQNSWLCLSCIMGRFNDPTKQDWSSDPILQLQLLSWTGGNIVVNQSDLPRPYEVRMREGKCRFEYIH